MLAQGLGWDVDRRRHVLPGRLLLSVTELERNPDACSFIVRQLQDRPGIEAVIARPLTGRVLVRFDAAELCPDEIAAAVDALMRAASIERVADASHAVAEVSAAVDRELDSEPGLDMMGPGAAFNDWHALPLREVLRRLATPIPGGLDVDEAIRRLDVYGANELSSGEQPSLARLIFRKLTNPMTLLLIGTGGLSLVVAQWLEALAALSIAGMTTYLGVRREAQANLALESLEHLSAPHAVVVRNGRTEKIAVADVVPGDLIVLEAGDRIPADARVVFSTGCQVDESTLTGESCPVVKDPNTRCNVKTSLAERGNMLYAGTVVVSGRARAVVVATGMATRVGMLASQLGEEHRVPTPLQGRLQRLAKGIVWIIVGLGVAGTVASFARGHPLGLALSQAVSVAVTAMPHGLPMTVTIALSMAVARLARQGAMTRRLGAMESLGATTAICSDKTGTLTCNQLVVREIVTSTGAWEVTGEGYAPAGEFVRDGVAVMSDGSVRELLEAAALCSNARLVSASGSWRVEGDATEGALLVAGVKAGYDPEAWRARHQRLHEVPFSAEMRRMSVVCENEDGAIVVAKGAPEAILPMCSHVVGADGATEITAAMREQWYTEAERLASRGLRVLAFARKVGVRSVNSAADGSLTFLGIAGMFDAPRAGVADAVKRCRQAGIRVLMLTGDHPQTAAAIAREVGILEDDGLTLTGAELDALSDAELTTQFERLAVGARMAPEHKLRIVRFLKGRGEVVAMTGDGVNDAPALQSADVGIAMGLGGTEVTKGAANLILTDDDFRSIVSAVESGRTVYGNIRRSLTYSLSTNGGEALMALIPLLVGMPLPVPVAPLLLSNMLCDGPVSLSLATDSPKPGLMTLPPRPSHEAIFDRSETQSMVMGAATIGLTTIGLYAAGVALTASPAVASSMALLGLVGTKLLLAHRLRRSQASDSPAGPGEANWLLRSATVLGLGFSAIGMYVPAAAQMLGLAPLGLAHVAIVAAAVLAQSSMANPRLSGLRRGFGDFTRTRTRMEGAFA